MEAAVHPEMNQYPLLYILSINICASVATGKAQVDGRGESDVKWK